MLTILAFCGTFAIAGCGAGSEVESAETTAEPIDQLATGSGADSGEGNSLSPEGQNESTEAPPPVVGEQGTTDGGSSDGGGTASPPDSGGSTPPAYVPPVVSTPSQFSGPIPAWRQSMNVWEWRAISGSDIAGVAPIEMPEGRLASRIGAWNGMAADTSTNTLYLAGVGGHADYAGNEAYSINLSSDSPSWQILNQPTPRSEVTWESSYYADGRPSSTHTYYALQFVSRLNRVFRVGSGSNWGSGNHKDWNMNAFNVSVNDWDPEGTWPVVDNTKPRLGYAICKNPETEEIYAAGLNDLRRFKPESGTWETMARFIQNGSSTLRRACVVDHSRNRVVFLGDRYRMNVGGGLVFDVANRAFSEIDFSGPAVSTLMSRDEGYAFLDSSNNNIFFVGGVGSEILRIDPVNWTVTTQPTTGGASMPNASNGVHTRFQYLPGLGGFAYYPAPGAGVWFVASE